MEYSNRVIEELRFMTFPGSFGDDIFLSKPSERYEKYASLMEKNKIDTTDIIIIRDILLFVGKDCEEFLLDLFVAKNNGSLTVSVNGDFIKNHLDLFMELDEINRKIAPVIFFDKDKEYEFEFYKAVDNNVDGNCQPPNPPLQPKGGSDGASLQPKGGSDYGESLQPKGGSDCGESLQPKGGSDGASLQPENIPFSNEGFDVLPNDEENIFNNNGESLQKNYEIDSNKEYYCGFHKYIKAAELLRRNLAKRLEINQENYDKVDTNEYKNAIEKAIEKMEYKPCLEQKVAIATSMINKSFSVISGGPGTGKTTVVFSLLNSLYNHDDSYKASDIVLLAPTGRAAGRLQESVKAAAEKLSEVASTPFLEELKRVQGYTIHKYLKPIDLKEKPNKKQNKIVIVDEVSMVDIYIMSSLFNNLGEDTKLILVGDYNQLPSIDAGCVMADLSVGRENAKLKKLVRQVLDLNESDFNIGNERDENKSKAPMEFVADLKVNHRANVEDLKKAFVSVEIEDNLDKVNEINNLTYEKGTYILNEKDIWKRSEIVRDFLKHGYFEKDDILGKSYIEFVKDIVEEIDFSKNVFSLDSEEGKIFEKLFNHINKYRVICPLRSGVLGCERINKNFLKDFRKYTQNNDDFALGQPIMVVKNDYKLNVSNGDNGIVLCDNNGVYKVIFKIKENYVAYLVTNFDYFENAFAITVHKSQGSEYDNVLIPIENYSEFITKELLYTALTRAKESFVLMSDKNTVKEICKNKIKRVNDFKIF